MPNSGEVSQAAFEANVQTERESGVETHSLYAPSDSRV
jgi:hypothetical protein